MKQPAFSWWTWCSTEAEKPGSPVKFITSLSKPLSFGFELYALGAAKGWITVIHISSAFFSSFCSREEKSVKKKKCQNQLINMVIMINMKDYVCLIDPSFINPRKYCYWHVLPFPAGSAEVLREMFLAKGISWCPFCTWFSTQEFLHPDLLILCCASLTAHLMWKPQPKLPLSPLSLKHCCIPVSPAHLQRILFWPE